MCIAATTRFVVEAGIGTFHFCTIHKTNALPSSSREFAMMNNLRSPACIFFLVGICVTILSAAPATAEQPEQAKAAAPLVIDGAVLQVYRSTSQQLPDSLLEIEVQRSEGRKSLPEGARVRFPGPGDSVYVHVRTRPEGTQQNIPKEGARVRAYLTPAAGGGWESAALETPEASPTGSGRDDDSEDGVARSSLGMTTEVFKVENRIALRVTSVERSGAAQKAGLEVGDIIAGVEGAAIAAADQLETLADKGKPFSLIVIDVNTGRGAQVDIDPTPTSETAEEAAAPPQAPRISLGISAEPVTLGTRSALKVTRVDPAGAAAKAGVEPGDIVVAANGAPITGPEQLLGALRKAGQTLTLTVRDSRTGRDAEVEVNLGGPKPAKPLPAEVETPVAASPGKLGAVTELAFHNDDFAVKVTEVETGSPAARAGLRPGVIILAANGQPVLHPNELNDAVRKSGGTLKLTVIDSITGKKSNVDVNLGR
jgi:S1-C subfamily serine protease